MIMNKKVSTIFAMAALMGGAFCSSAYAESLDTFVDVTTVVASDKASGDFFLSVGNDGYLGSDWVDDTKAITKFWVENDLTKDDPKLTKETINKYLWTVGNTTLPGGIKAYSFTNKETGVAIRVDISGATPTIVTAAPKDGDAYEIWFSGDAATTNAYTAGGSGFSLAATVTGAKYLNWDETAATPALAITAISTDKIELQKLLPGIEISDGTELNKLYNSAGFNFDLNDADLANVGNLFGEKNIIAINVDKDYHKDNSAENADYYFPEGIYFATSVPRTLRDLDGDGDIDENPWYDYLTQCTFIAVDADSYINDDEDKQKDGEYFTLTEVSGKDLQLYMDTKEEYKATGNQISVKNACFSAKESTTSDDVFALYLENIRIQEKAGADKQIDLAGFALTANEDYASVYTVKDADKEGNFIFKYSESSVVNPIDLLKADGASIYNIRFYKANGKDNSVNGKYLTTTADKNSFFAKGKVLADLDAPAYQWVISKVDGKDITFTNRESGATLTTQLFDEGNGRYSLAPKALNGVETGVKSFYYYNLTEEGNVEIGKKDNGTTDVQYFQGSYVELIESKAVNYAGYLNVDDETLMTLSFGRDIAPTSNKLYPFVTVGTDNTDNGRMYDFNDNEELTNEVGDAAQWLLIKNPTDTKTHSWKYNYAYANGELVNIKNNGDVVYASTYALQLVLDGKVVKSGDNPYYLNISSGKAEISTTLTEFYIQENVDGSVLLKTAKDGATALFLEDEYTSGSNAGELIMDMNKLALNSFDMATISETTSKANEIKTYLIAEAPAISLPGNEGHYSFVSETGNYITKDENRDAFAAREESEAMYLYVTDKDAVVPSFYVTLGKGEAEGERMFLFCPQDSVDYYVANGIYNKQYQWDEEETKAIFKSAAINETRDTLTTSIKGEATLVASEANNTEEVEGGIERFKMQIVEAQDADGMYVVRQVGGDWLKSINGKLAWGAKTDAIKFEITGAEAPTANEGVAATEVKVIATDGAINIKNAAGKNVVISTILGQIVANEVLTSDNATISVPAGIAIVSVDGEEAVKVSVK